MGRSRSPSHQVAAHGRWPKASAREGAEVHKGVFLASSYLWLREFVRQRWFLCVTTLSLNFPSAWLSGPLILLQTESPCRKLLGTPSTLLTSPTLTDYTSCDTATIR